MATHSTDDLLLLHIPDLNLPVVSAYAQVSALLRPSHRSDSIPFTKVHQLANRGRIGIPDVDVLGESDSQGIQR